jgi:hypothetical protein
VSSLDRHQHETVLFDKVKTDDGLHIPFFGVGPQRDRRTSLHRQVQRLHRCRRIAHLIQAIRQHTPPATSSQLPGHLWSPCVGNPGSHPYGHVLPTFQSGSKHRHCPSSKTAPRQAKAVPRRRPETSRLADMDRSRLQLLKKASYSAFQD